MAINMSYCRFRNAFSALCECYEALNEETDPLSNLSEEEHKAALLLFKLCADIADDYHKEAA